MKRSILFSLCMIFVMGFSTYSPKSSPILPLTGNDIVVTIDWGGAEFQDPDEDPVKEYIVDGNPNSAYDILGRSDDGIKEVKLLIVPNIEITLPERTYIEELNYKFAVKVKAWHERCYGYRIKADGVVLGYDTCKPGGETGTVLDGGWEQQMYESSVDVKRYVSKFTIELEGYGFTRKPYDNEVTDQFYIFEIEPVLSNDETDPEVNFPANLPPGTATIPKNIVMGIPVRDIESGLKEISMNCKFYRFELNLLPLPDPVAASAELHQNIPAFAPGTTDPVTITLEAKKLPSRANFSCGIWAKDIAGHEVYVEKGFRVQ